MSQQGEVSEGVKPTGVGDIVDLQVSPRNYAL